MDTEQTITEIIEQALDNISQEDGLQWQDLRALVRTVIREHCENLHKQLLQEADMRLNRMWGECDEWD